MFPSYRNQSGDLFVYDDWMTGYYMMGTLTVKGLTKRLQYQNWGANNYSTLPMRESNSVHRWQNTQHKLLRHTALKWGFSLRISSVNLSGGFLQKYFFFQKSFFSKLRIWSHLLKKSVMENFIFSVVPLTGILLNYPKRLYTL